MGSDLFTEDHWRDVGKALHRGSKQWWDAHREELIDLGKDEARDIFRALKKGKRIQAQYEVIALMVAEDPVAWKAYRDGTTEHLRGIAARRAKLLDALKELGWFAARTIGTAALAAL